MCCQTKMLCHTRRNNVASSKRVRAFRTRCSTRQRSHALWIQRVLSESVSVTCSCTAIETGTRDSYSYQTVSTGKGVGSLGFVRALRFSTKNGRTRPFLELFRLSLGSVHFPFKLLLLLLHSPCTRSDCHLLQDFTKKNDSKG